MITASESGVCSSAGMSASSYESIAVFKRANPLKRGWQIVNSLLPFCSLWYVMYLSVSWSYWLASAGRSEGWFPSATVYHSS
jgi:hypothetical protein